MEILIIWLLCAGVAAAIAGGKDRSRIGWFLLGLLLGIFAVIIVACLPSLRPQEFIVENADGTASMVESIPRGRSDWVGMFLAIGIVFAGAAVLDALITVLGG